MELTRQAAYRTLLAHAFLHIKWDLACHPLTTWVAPWAWPRIASSVRRAAHRAIAFHNLAIFSTNEFERFSEEKFWNDVDWLLQRCPDSAHSNYRDVFNRLLEGKPVSIVKPNG